MVWQRLEKEKLDKNHQVLIKKHIAKNHNDNNNNNNNNNNDNDNERRFLPTSNVSSNNNSSSSRQFALLVSSPLLFAASLEPLGPYVIPLYSSEAKIHFTHFFSILPNTLLSAFLLFAVLEYSTS